MSQLLQAASDRFRAGAKDRRINLWDLLVNGLCRALCWLLRAVGSKRVRTLPRADDPSQPLLTQVLLWHSKRKGVSVYLQHFEGPESWDYFHRHRWSHMRSFILSGMYLEERPQLFTFWDLPSPHPITICDGTQLIHRRRFQTYTMDQGTIHRVDYWAPLCWTIFYTKDPTNQWGYYPRGGTYTKFIPWQQFIKQRVPSLETGKVSQ